MGIYKIRTSLQAHKGIVVDLAIILLLGLVSITWFRGNFLIEAGDMSFPLSATKDLPHSLYVWGNQFSTGGVNSRGITSIPFVSFLAFCEIIGLSIITAEKILFYFLFASAGLAMYFLTWTVISGGGKRLARLIAALFYMFNFYAMTMIWGIHWIPQIMLYAALPLALALYIRGLRSKRTLLYCLLISGFLLPVSFIYVDPVYTSILWLVMLSYLIYHFLSYRKNKAEIIYAFRFTVFLGIAWIAVNSWWIIPMAFFSGEELQYATKAMGASNIDVLTGNTVKSSLLNLLRLDGWWGFNSNYGPDPYYSYSHNYSKIAFLVIGFLIPLLAFSPLLFRSKNRRFLIYFAGLSLVGMFLSKGAHAPFGEVPVWLMSKFPLLGIFRMPFNKLMVITALSYAVLIGSGLTQLYDYIKGKNMTGKIISLKKRLANPQSYRKVGAGCCLLVLLFSICGAYVYPMWTGDVIFAGGDVVPSHRTAVPTYYGDANDWINRDAGDFRIFVAPNSINAFNWGWSYLFHLFPAASVITHDYRNDLLVYARDLIDKGETQRLGEVLGLLNAKYAVVPNDFNQQYCWWLKTPEYYRSALSSQQGLHLERSFGKLDFYKNDYWQPLHIYTTSNTILVNGGVNELFRVIASDSFRVGESALFLSEQASLSQRQFIQEYSARNSNHALEISFQKINPTKYQVKVTDTTEPFFLVFSESYHPQWKAYMNPKGGDTNWFEAFFHGYSIPEDKHFLVNGYANAWYIEPEKTDKDGNGSFTITLYFWPQSLFYLGLGISGFTLLGCLGYLGYNWRKRKRNNNVADLE